MRKILILCFFLPFLVFSHQQDNGLFSTTDVLPGALILLDRSGSMNTRVTDVDTTVMVGRADVVLSQFDNDNSTHLEGWYDEEIWPDGGRMSDFNNIDANDDWVLTVTERTSWGGWANDSAVVDSWILRFYQGGSYTDFSGGSFGLRIDDRSISDTISVAGVGTIDSVECYLDVTAARFVVDSTWRRWPRPGHWDYIWYQTTIGLLNITLNGPALTTNITRLTRIQCALKVIHSLLDANNDGFVTEEDEELLLIKIGQGFFIDAPNRDFTGINPSDYCYVYNEAYGSSGTDRGSYYDEYDRTWKNASDGRLETDALGAHFIDIWNHMNFTVNEGYTPNGPLIREGTTYISNWKIAHPELWCMKQNIILITDGESNRGTYCDSDWERDGPQELVRRAYEAFHDDTIKVFAVGFGPDIGVAGANQLNWAARWGGTCANPLAISGDTMAVDPRDSCPTVNPSNRNLSGYAYIAEDADALAASLASIFTDIAGQKEKGFSSAEVTSIEEDYTSTEYQARMYLASFYPEEGPFWEGHLRSVKLVVGGLSFENIPDSLLIWDAGDLLREREPDTRNIYGIKGSSIQEFNSSNFSATDLAVGSSAEAERVVNLVRCGVPYVDSISYLGDIFHSSPLRVGSPSYWYRDDGFAQYRDNMSSRASVIYAGSNTGLLHAFYDSTGEETFAVVPENFVPEVKTLTDSHRFYVDANPMAADVWFPKDGDADTFKNADEWKTVLMACQGEGGRGITCLDVTNPATVPPPHLFSIYDTATMGYTTSVPVMFKIAKEVGTETVERFFAFFGGGEWPESMYNIYSPGSQVRGNVIVALDIYGASTAGSLSEGINYWFIPPASEDGSKMVYPFASAASVVNLNPRYDNLYDLLYIPDLAGQMWKVDLTDPDISNWTARCIFQPPIPSDSTQDSLWQPAFFAPLVEREPATGCLWLFYGTGDRSKVFKENTENRFYAILDTLTDDTTDYPLTEDNLKSVWTYGPFDFPSEFPDFKGWYIVYSDSSTHVDEKTVSQASLFLDTLKFVTFEPTEASSDCNIGSGGAREYSYHFRTGSGRFKSMGGGIPQAPRYSFDQSGSGYEIHQTSDSLWVELKAGFGTLKRILQWKER
jgi:hypothetical protein